MAARGEGSRLSAEPDETARHESVAWRGRYRERVVAAAAQIAQRHAPHWSDWWIYGVVPLAVLHLTLFLILQARPGALALRLWRWGPATLVVTTAALLVWALAAAVWGKLSWSRQRALALVGLCGLVVTEGSYRTFPSVHDRTPSTVALRLPLDGPVTVGWGGATPAVNYHVSSPPERWGYDLLVTVDRRSHAGEGTRLDDYYAYGRPVRAPADGRVVEVVDAFPDRPPHQPDRQAGGGNRVLVEIAPRQFLLIGHLQPGSLRIQRGDIVKRGEVVGLVGNSGNSSEPHVHLHLQDAREVDASQGIPVYFARYRTLDGVVVERGMPEGGVASGRYVGSVVTSLEDSER